MSFVSFAELAHQVTSQSFVVQSDDDGNNSGSEDDNNGTGETKMAEQEQEQHQQLFDSLINDNSPRKGGSIFIDRRYWMSDKSAKICTDCSQKF
jgi:hypothetical protein